MADVSVDAGISQSTARGCRALVFTTDQIGYFFFIDGDGVFGYCKTTDGGATWGAQVNVDGAGAATTCAFDVWFDKWTSPTDTGTLIHTWWFDTTNDIVRWRTLDTNGDTLGTVRTVFTGASAVAGRGCFVSGCKTQSGYLYAAYDLDAGAERGLHRSTDNGTTWVANLSTTFIEATLDTCKLYPAYGTGDGNDCWAIYYDASALAITLKLWDSSAGSATESATIGASHTDGATDLTGQFGYDAMVRWSDGHLILAKISLRDNASSTHQVFDITDTSTITTKTAITTNIDDHYYPQIFIEQGPNTLYVMYNGKRDGSETMDTATKVYYTKSTDGGTTWVSGDTAYMEGTAGVVLQLWTPQTTHPGTTRLAAVWRVAATLLTNKVNSVVFQTIKGANIASTASISSLYGPGFVWEAIPTPVMMGTSLLSQTDIGPNPEDAWQYYFLELFETGFPVGAKVSSFSGTVNQVAAALSYVFFNALPLGTISMTIRSGSYNGTVLATSTNTFSASDLQDTRPTWVVFQFAATVLASGTYWFALERSNVGFTNYFAWHYSPDGDVLANFLGFEDASENVAQDPAIYIISDTPPIAVGSAVTAPTVAPGAVTVVGTTIAAGSAANAPTTVAAEQSVTGTTIAAGSGVNIPTVAYAVHATHVSSTISGLYNHPNQQSLQVIWAGQSFIGNGGTLVGMKFQMSWGNGGTVSAALYAATGTHGTNAKPTGAALATSDSVSTVSSAIAYRDFTFSGVNQVVLTAGTTYIAVCHGVVTLGQVYYVQTNARHEGNVSTTSDGTTWSTTTGDLLFEVDTAPSIFSPTVAYAPSGATITTGSSVTAPSDVEAVASGQPVTGTTIASGSAVTAPSVIQTALGATITTGSVVTAPTVAPGAVTVVGANISSGSGINAPTLKYVVTTGFIEPELQDHSWPTSVDALNQGALVGLAGSLGTYIGQEFWIRQKERLTSIDLRLSRTGTPVDNVSVEIYADLRSGGPVIGVSSSVAGSSVPLDPVFGDDSDFVNFTFTFSDVDLFPGFYAWVIKRSGTGTAINTVNVHMDGPSRLSAEIGLVYQGDINDWVESTQAFQYRLHFATSVFAPTTVTPGAVTVVGATRPTTIQVFAPSTTAVALGATITSGSGTFAPRTAYALTTPTISTSSTVNVPTVAIAITTTAIAVGSQVFAATVTPGATTVVGATITTTVQVFNVVVVREGEFAATTIASTAQVFIPTVIADRAVTTAFISRSYAAAIIGDQPTLYWRLDETGATAVDEISEEVGTISGGVTSIAGPLAGGNAAMHFDGTGKIVPATNFRLHAGSWSVEGWFKRVAVPGGGNDFESWWSNGHFTNGAFYLGVHAGGTAQGQWIGATPSFIDSGISGLTGAWHHMVVTYDGARWRLYMDGVLRTNDAVTAATEPWPTPQQPGCIAWEPNRNRFWTGDVDEVAIYPYTLTDEQIAVHYAAASSLSLETQAFAPTVAPGAVTVTGARIAASSAVQAPTIAVGAVTISGASRGSASQVFAPMVTPITAGATITSTVQLIAPTVTPGAVTVLATRIVSALQLHAPTVVPGAATVLGATLASGSQTRAPSVVMVTQGATIPALSQVFAPVVVIEYRITTAFVGSTLTLLAPTVEVEIIPILVGDIGPASEVFPPSLIARLFPPLALAHARVGVRYLVTSADVTCMMSATGGVSVRYLGVGGEVTTPVLPVTATVAVRYLVESDGVSVNVLEAT